MAREKQWERVVGGVGGKSEKYEKKTGREIRRRKKSKRRERGRTDQATIIHIHLLYKFIVFA